MNEITNETQKLARRVVRSRDGAYDYIFEGDETICVLLVPKVATPEYSQRVAEIITAPQMRAVLKHTNKLLREITGIGIGANTTAQGGEL